MVYFGAHGFQHANKKIIDQRLGWNLSKSIKQNCLSISGKTTIIATTRAPIVKTAAAIIE